MPHDRIHACDCHIHVYDTRYPAADGATLAAPRGATIADYRRLQPALGTSRVVVVTPSTYGTDNRPMLDALAAMGDGARGVAVIDPATPEPELRRMHAAGVRGVRINAMQRGRDAFDDVERLSGRIAPLGWHLQLFGGAQLWHELQPRLAKLPVPLVFDHFGNIPPGAATEHPAFAAITQLMKEGKAWVKLSGAMNISDTGAPYYADVDVLAHGFLAAEPTRVVWGTDWPHPAMRSPPDDVEAMRALPRWCDNDAGLLQHILVDNPARLYDFGVAR